MVAPQRYARLQVPSATRFRKETGIPAATDGAAICGKFVFRLKRLRRWP